ncbi:tRNA methyltransferase 10 homolog B-like [Rhopilema esculentum]|uniref:tRNA methyltransferase 10 homolog B-like n=1 Tax=Rhopilema esculentum TaxID=499914 RepID=UPI0031DD654E
MVNPCIQSSQKLTYRFVSGIRLLSSSVISQGRLNKMELHNQKRQKLRSALMNGQKIAIDFNLPNIMTDKDRWKLARQIKLLYHINMNCQAPVSLNFIGLRENTLVNACFIEVFKEVEEIIANFVNGDLTVAFPNKSLVYLTPDAEQPLQFFDINEVYILGGLVDYQVRKNTTLRKAKDLNLQARRLPIPEYMEKKDGNRYNYSKILTINQVFDILLKYQETHDWRQSLPVGLPARRGYTPRLD